MYATADELLVEVRLASRKYPAEHGRLKEIASLVRRDLAAGIAAFADWQSTITGSGKAESPQPVVDGAATQNALPGDSEGQPPVAPESAQTRDDAPGDASHTAVTQSASGGITEQSTLSGEADAGALLAEKLDAGAGVTSLTQAGASRPTPVCVKQPDNPTCTDTGKAEAPSVAPESTQTGAEPAGDTLPTSASQGASTGTTARSAQPGRTDSQTDAMARLRAQIDGCLELETNPALQLFLKQLARDSHRYPAELVRQELETYTQAANPDDFLNRLAALHWQWALDDAAADPDGRRLTRGSTGERKAVLARIQSNFDWETAPVLRCYLAKLARQAVTDPVKAADGLEGYLDGRTSPTWVWLAAVFVAGSPEAAFQWRLQEARREVADARLSGYLDTLEQTARKSLPLAAGKLEAFIEILALQTAGIPAAVA